MGAGPAFKAIKLQQTAPRPSLYLLCCPGHHPPSSPSSSSLSPLFLILIVHLDPIPTSRMGLLDRLRSRPRRSAGLATEHQTPPRSAKTQGRDYTRKLPRPVLAYIFAYVCPHTVDNSLETSEESMTDGCMLCDMRDLAHAALVCKRWYLEARALLYVTAAPNDLASHIIPYFLQTRRAHSLLLAIQMSASTPSTTANSSSSSLRNANVGLSSIAMETPSTRRRSASNSSCGRSANHKG